VKTQLLVDVILDRLPASNSAITFTLINPRGSVSKNKYYVN